MLTAVIVAGGSSRRMGLDKTFAPLLGRPAIAHSIAAFERAAEVATIVIVGRVERLADLEQLVQLEKFLKVFAIVAGGERRQDSVRVGLEQLPPDTEFVAVHDAARALVRPDLIAKVFAAAREHGGAAPAAPVADTLKRAQEGLVVGGVERGNLFAVQTPQIFRRDLLARAYRSVREKEVEITDEISAIETIGGKVFLVPNDEPNFKITYPADLPLAEFILRERSSSRAHSS
jgi:2-C-methyl-D-erythritol 4-phosphate cytidylyltransferase